MMFCAVAPVEEISLYDAPVSVIDAPAAPFGVGLFRVVSVAPYHYFVVFVPVHIFMF